MLLKATALAAILVFSATGSYAAGSGGNDDVKPCPKGQVWVKALKKCVKRQSEGVTDDDIYATARLLAKAGDYDGAIALLGDAADGEDKRILTYLGFSHRKAGRFDVGFAYYQRALAKDPDYVLAREYLGEGYAAQGKLDLAKAELAEIAKRCGVTCEEYVDLAEAIEAAN